MATNLTPLNWDWSPVVKGDTFPATQITETLNDSALTRVRVKLKLSGATTTSLTLDSATSGVTITTATAGAWDFSIDAIQTVTLAAGVYSYDLETTDAASTIRTEFSGTWEILEQITD